jgi:hypothetical protein
MTKPRRSADRGAWSFCGIALVSLEFFAQGLEVHQQQHEQQDGEDDHGDDNLVFKKVAMGYARFLGEER